MIKFSTASVCESVSTNFESLDPVDFWYSDTSSEYVGQVHI